jgi:hypothetical protein
MENDNMSPLGVQFDEKQTSYSPNRKVKGMAGFVMRSSGGSIKNELQANLVLVIIALIAFAFAVFLFVSNTNDEIDQKYFYNPPTTTL